MTNHQYNQAVFSAAVVGAEIKWGAMFIRILLIADDKVYFESVKTGLVYTYCRVIGVLRVLKNQDYATVWACKA